ncbi:MAG TPA: DUF2085 domain-containing protein [Pyrinomonadaceae bacterium]|nr:DUF2085 domain-containing protein [Pyrinomonadaceae bacterium]
MTELAENYVPVSLQVEFRRQALRVWMATTAVLLLWLGAIVLAPLLAPSGLSTSIYTFFSYICHQIPDRSLHLAGHQLGVCSRCLGVYFGLLAGVVVYPLWRRIEENEPISRFWLFASLIPISIDWSLTVFGIWENTHLSRFVTGLILGLACATFIVPAVVDIARNLSQRKKRTAS